MQHILKRTIYEEFGFDPIELLVKYAEHFKAYEIKRSAERQRFGHSPLTYQEMQEGFIVELFEAHNGSQFGDNLFSALDEDSGIEIFERGDDE